MPGSRQLDAIRSAFRRGDLAMPRSRFEWMPRTHYPNGTKRGRAKMRCVLCHAEGYGPLDPADIRDASPWQVQHLLEHAYPCVCGRAYVSANHLQQHINRERWPRREGVHRPVTGLRAAVVLARQRRAAR